MKFVITTTYRYGPRGRVTVKVRGRFEAGRYGATTATDMQLNMVTLKLLGRGEP